MKPSRYLAAAQTVPARGDVEANVHRHVELAHAAADAQARVVVFPELSLTGYELNLLSDLAFTVRDARLEPLRAVARRLGLTMVVGAPVRSASKLHIGAFILMPDGSLDLHTKRHLGEGEQGLVDPGNLDPLVDVGRGHGAVAICADANRPSHPSKAAARGADTYLVSTFIAPEELEPKAATLRGFAIRHALTVVFADYGGPTGGLESGGRSAIWSDTGEPLARLDGVGTGLVVSVDEGSGWSGTPIR